MKLARKKLGNPVAYLLAVVALALSGCGNGGDTSSASSSSGGSATASSIQVLVGSTQLSSSAVASTTVTAIVLDSSGQAVSGKAVTFGKGSDSTAYFSGVSSVTNSNGVATATLNIGSDMTNRVITVSATADSATGSNTVTVTGTKISVTGNTSLTSGATTTLNISVKDSTGASVSGAQLSISSANGNPISVTPSSGITDATGQVVATVTATSAGSGTDTITITGAGVTQTATLTINADTFSFTAPAAVAPATTPEIPIDTLTPVSVTWTSAGVGVSGKTINFTTTRGTLSAASAVTNASGVATVNIQASSTGSTIVTAEESLTKSPAGSLTVIFVTTSASSITAQASPSTVAINPSGSTGNQSVISVIVRDSNDNLVKNALVNFNQVADNTSGQLSAGSAVTDVTGIASINYIAGAVSSGQNGVNISATVTSVGGFAITPISTNVTLTVASQSMFVRLGTDNKVYPDTPEAGTTTRKVVALVTDSAGNAVPDGTQVRFTIRPIAYSTTIPTFFKGSYAWSAVDSAWIQTVSASCLNEDQNNNFLLDATEDANGNTFLDPLGVAAVNATATTASGFAVAQISYAKQYGSWVNMVLEARAGTVGNDPPATAVIDLANASSDYTNQAVPPPGDISPWGQSASCNNTN